MKEMKERTTKWKNRIFREWSISRMMRLGFGIGLIVVGIIWKGQLMTFLGVIFLLQGILNLSCCGAGGCSLSGNEKQFYKDAIKPYKPRK
jgi:uncharacterized membrane protein